MPAKSFKVFLDSDSTFDVHMEATAAAFWRARLAEVPQGENKVSALQWATRTPIHRIYRLLSALGIKY